MGDVQFVEGQVFDAAFYVSHYPDLAGLTPRAAEAHFRKWGRGEGRKPNAAALLDTLQKQYGPLPDDFDPQAYRRLNPDVGEGLSDAQAAMHYLVTGRGSHRLYAYADWLKRSDRMRRLASGEPHPETLVHRSWIAERRHDLALVFGPHLATDLLTRSTMRAMAASAEAPETIASPYMEPAVVGRFLLSAPKRDDEDFATVSTQLRVLFYALFGCPSKLFRRASELRIVNSLARRALHTQIASCQGALPPLTLFMAAARSTRPDFDLERDLAEPDRAVAEFFGSDVANLDLQRFVTSGQRAALRALGPDGRPLALAVRQTGWSEQAARRIMLGEPATVADWFFSEGAWALGMDYVLDSDQLALGQVRIEREEDGGEVLVVPPMLAALDPPSGADRSALQRWVGRFRQPEALGLSPLILSSSALEFVAGRREKKQLPVPPGETARRAENLVVQPGDLIVFGDGGNGEAFLIESDWRDLHAAEAWMARPCVQVALPMTLQPGTALDLFLDLRVGDSEEELELQVLWNGRLVSWRRHEFSASEWTHIHLGTEHRPPGDINVLILWAPGRSGAASEPPIAALQRLMLAVR